MNEKHIFSMLRLLWSDLAYPESCWAALLLVGVLFLAWRLSVGIKNWKSGPDAERGVLQHLDVGGVARLVFPTLAACLVFLLQTILSVSGIEHLSLLALAMPLIFSWALVRVIVYVLRCVFPHSGVLRRSERLIALTIWGVFILRITGFADPMIEFLEQISFMVGAQRLDLWQLMRGAVTVSLTLLIALWFGSLIEDRLSRAKRIDRSVRELLVRLSKSILLVLALLFSLSLVGIDVTMLSVFGGAFAVGLGFGLQKIASNYVSGFIILLDRSIRIGNIVAIDATTTGVVTQITMRYTVLRTGAGAEILIPNENFIGNVVRNFTFSDTKMRVSIAVQVAYDSDVKKAMRLMIEAAKRQRRVLSDPAPSVTLTEFAESGINLELGFWIADPEAGTVGVRSDIALDILEAFGENGVEMPYPQCDVRLLNPAPKQDSSA
ncbi:MAG: mechanosensitive ion channel [Candidatus Accumulibacter sp.]|jgi:small-conductance mechanosensitive channel|nr:mechanosensitive ion channel [Accumulibacter sp.]